MTNAPIDVAAEMRGAGLSGFHIRFAVLIGAILFLDGYDLFNAAYVAPYVRAQWGLGPAQIGQMLSIGLAGLAFGALLQGPLADRFGRRRITLAAVWLLGLASLALAFLAHDFATFCALRLVLGVALGMLSPLAFVYINEWAPSRCANGFATLAFVLPFSLGGIFAGVAGLLIAPRWGWQALYLVGGLAIPVALVAQAFLPESVRFLAIRRRWSEVARILARAIPERAALYGTGESFHSGEPERTRGAFGSLLSSRYRWVTLGIWSAGALSLLCIHGLTGWLPSIVLAEGAGIRTAFGYGTLLMTMQIFGGLVGGWLADRTDRITVIAGGFAGGAISLILLALTLKSPFALVTVAATGFFIFGAQAVMNNYIAMSYETSLRSTAVGVAVAVNRIGGVAGPLLIGFTQTLPNALWATLAMLAVAQVLAAVILIWPRLRRNSSPTSAPTVLPAP